MDKSKNAVSVFDKYAKEYQAKFMDVNLYGDTFDFFCSHIKKENVEILETACGPGNITQYLLKKRPDFKILATDLSLNMISLAKINNPTANFQILDCRDITILAKKFEGIMCGFCLPYLSKEETLKFISDAYKLLNTKGLLYISTMEDDYTKSGLRKGSQGDEIFMHFYEADFLTDALKENNFKILSLERKNTVMMDGSTVTDLIIISEK